MDRRNLKDTNKSGETSGKNEPKPTLIITGDKSIDRFIYLEGLPDEPANLREAWVNASRFWTVDLAGGAGTLDQLLTTSGVTTINPCTEVTTTAESIYILTRDNKGQRWSVGQAIVAGERDYPAGELKYDTGSLTDDTPAVIIDFNQGWVKTNRDRLADFLKDRPYIIRTHDPCKNEWKKIRQGGIRKGIWFSPIQDMADGSLWFPGNWESLHERLLEYLQADETIWKSGEWLHYIVIQISYDGAFVAGPGMPEQGELLIFKGDQPDSFSREGYETVVAGGIVFVYSLTHALLASPEINPATLLESARTGLARIREVVTEGYVGPVTGEPDWRPPVTTNLPVESLNTMGTKNIISYHMKPPEPVWETACDIVCGDEERLRERTVFRLGKLITASPEYAHSLLRLTSRLKNHMNNAREVLSLSIFGEPGSGKSFVAKQIAEATDPSGSRFRHKTFNLSQFNDQTRLVDAFKQIQTISLQGKIPFILWDEFDTSYNGSSAGWLSSFLMPMQDAEFFDGMANQALGKCIFVFIGGVFKDDGEFRGWISTDEGRRQKGTDFHSRLDSSLNIPSVAFKAVPADLFNTPDPARLNRAIMIRAFLRNEKKVKSIAPEVLSFLLHVPLQHGVRSLERIISASELRRTTYFQAFHLPPPDVLQLHVDESRINPHHSVLSFLEDIRLKMFQDPPLELEWRK